MSLEPSTPQAELQVALSEMEHLKKKVRIKKNDGSSSWSTRRPGASDQEGSMEGGSTGKNRG